jgi:Lon protease-like protein
MFPLGTVLVPTLALPLHVFEPRYRALVRHCLAGDRELGIVLIERGSEVGGGEVRTDVGTRGRITQAVELPDGRWAIEVVGFQRLRVGAWLPDDPFPIADVDDWPDPAPGPRIDGLLDRTVTLLRRALALASEAGDDAPPATVELAPDAVVAGYQATALAPIGVLDRQHLLAAPTPDDRLDALGTLLEDAVAVLQQRLAGG